MDIKWTQGLSEKDAQTIRELVSRNTMLRTRLKEILEAELASSETLRLKDYDSPNWAFKQADTNGYQRALRKIITLIG